MFTRLSFGRTIGDIERLLKFGMLVSGPFTRNCAGESENSLLGRKNRKRVNVHSAMALAMP